MYANIKDYFLATLINNPEYIKVQYKYISDDMRR